MTTIEDLNARQRRIVNEVRDELTRAVGAAGARAALETRAAAAHARLANPQLQPVAFGLRHLSRWVHLYGVLWELLAWLVFLSALLLLCLAFLACLVAAVGALVFLRPDITTYALKAIPKVLEKFEPVNAGLKRRQWTAQRRRRNAYLRLLADTREPVLYLRSFSFDIVYEPPAWDPRKPEERLAEHYEAFGPVIAVAGPDDKGPSTGPVKLYFDDDNWRAAVTYLLSVSQLVIIQAGISQGTLWELGMARRMLRPEQLIISLADAPSADPTYGFYPSFKPYAEVILGCELPGRLGRDAQIRFAEDWTARDPHGRGRRARAAAHAARETRYVKCPACGLNNWHESEACERCGGVLASA